MDTSKLSLGEQIAAASGIALLVVMFLPWYGASVSSNLGGGISVSDSANAWQVFSFIDILLFLVAVVAIGVPVARATDSLPDDVPGALICWAQARSACCWSCTGSSTSPVRTSRHSPESTLTSAARSGSSLA